MSRKSKKKVGVKVGGNWHTTGGWSRAAKSTAFMVAGEYLYDDQSLQRAMTASAVEVVANDLYLISLPAVAREFVASCDGAMQSIRDEARKLIAQYGQYSVLRCDSLPENLKAGAIRLGGGFYLTKERVSMPLREFLFYDELFDYDQAILVLEEWSGIPNAKIRDFRDYLFGYLQTFIRRQHSKAVRYAQPPVVAINDAGSGTRFSFENCTVDIVNHYRW